MLVNRSIYFHKLREKRSPPIQFATVHPIRDAIGLLSVEISTLRKKQSRQALPSFSSRTKKMREVEAHRERISAGIRAIEADIKAITLPEKRIVASIQAYFLAMLKRLVVLYRTIQQESLARNEIYNEYTGQDPAPSEDSTLKMTAHRTAQVRQSIFNLTNTLLELKLALRDQSMTLDRIDFFFDKSNFYLEEANREIDKIPNNHTAFKDFIIYFLLYLIGVLLVLILVKMARDGHK